MGDLVTRLAKHLKELYNNIITLQACKSAIIILFTLIVTLSLSIYSWKCVQLYINASDDGSVQFGASVSTPIIVGYSSVKTIRSY